MKPMDSLNYFHLDQASTQIKKIDYENINFKQQCIKSVKIFFGELGGSTLVQRWNLEGSIVQALNEFIFRANGVATRKSVSSAVQVNLSCDYIFTEQTSQIREKEGKV